MVLQFWKVLETLTIISSPQSLPPFLLPVYHKTNGHLLHRLQLPRALGRVEEATVHRPRS